MLMICMYYCILSCLAWIDRSTWRPADGRSTRSSEFNSISSTVCTVYHKRISIWYLMV